MFLFLMNVRQEFAKLVSSNERNEELVCSVMITQLLASFLFVYSMK
jgi:hypothetical protein